MNKNKNVPEIRFEGFDEDWIKCNIDQIPGRTVYNKGKGLTKDDLVKKQKYKPAILYGHIFTQYGNYLKDVIFSTLENSNDSVISEIGDLIIPASSTTSDNAIVKGLAVNKSGILYGGDINIIRFDNNFTNVFLAYYLDNSSLKNRMFKVVQGTTIHHLYLNAIKDVDVQIPLPEEQIQIGNFFKNLDEKLDLEKEKHKKLIKFKKAMLDEMFPKEGEKVPKVRFEGFDDEWGNTELKNILKSERKGKAQMAFLKPGKNLYLDADTLNGNNTFFCDSIPDVNRNDILILWDGSKAGTVYSNVEGVLGSTLKALSLIDSINSYYIYSFLYSKKESIFNYYRTPNIPHVVKDFTSIFKIPIPSKEEQVQIGNFFKNLDEKIEHTEEKIKKIEDFKKAMLEKMFV